MYFPASKAFIPGATLRQIPLFIALLVLALIPVACEKPAPVVFQPVPVDVAKVETADVPIKLRSIGTVEAVQSVAVSALVGGYLQEVHIKDGQPVNEGQILFKIDSRKFEVALKQNEANLEQVRIQWQSAVKEVQRADSLLKDNIITPQEQEKLQTAADSLQAALKLQEALLENSRLDLSFCTIRSPISGRAGSLLVHKGDLIKANASIFVTINQINPVRVKFSIPEKELGVLRSAMAAGTVSVSATLPQNSDQGIEGKLVFIDNAVDVQTGSIILKAEFANDEELLWPGQFVETSVMLGTMKDALIVPSGAVQTGQQGTFVFVVDAQKKAAIRKVVTGLVNGESTIILDGLKAEEAVVTDGQIRLGDGMPVNVRKTKEPASEKSE